MASKKKQQLPNCHGNKPMKVAPALIVHEGKTWQDVRGSNKAQKSMTFSLWRRGKIKLVLLSDGTLCQASQLRRFKSLQIKGSQLNLDDENES